MKKYTYEEVLTDPKFRTMTLKELEKWINYGPNWKDWETKGEVEWNKIPTGPMSKDKAKWLMEYYKSHPLCTYKKGDKVVPISKSRCGALSMSGVWRRAQAKGQAFIFILRWDEDENCFVCHEDKASQYGDYFLAEDLIPYESDPKTITINIPENKMATQETKADSIVITFKDVVKEKTFDRYAGDYMCKASEDSYFVPGENADDITAVLISKDPKDWPAEFKYGLLCYIAKQVNGKGERTQVIACNSWGGICFQTLYAKTTSCAMFDSEGIQKAMKIIPASFVSSF